jgi:hypothetical protein
MFVVCGISTVPWMLFLLATLHFALIRTYQQLLRERQICSFRQPVGEMFDQQELSMSKIVLVDVLYLHSVQDLDFICKVTVEQYRIYALGFSLKSELWVGWRSASRQKYK